MAIELNEYVVSNDVLTNARELRERMKRDGYLFFRELIDPAPVWDLREDVLGVLQQAGWLKEGARLGEGIANGERTTIDTEPEYGRVYNEVQKLQSFHRLAHFPVVLSMMEILVCEEVLPHPANIARLIFPQTNRFTTPPHQDFVHIQGATETYSCWIPLGDCPREFGGLSVLAGSHNQGLHDYHFALGAGGMGVDTDHLQGDWLTVDYRAGDALIFHSFTVHKSLPNTTADRMRLSVDYRYQGVSQEILDVHLRPHLGQLTWEEIYGGWKSKELQYYWQNLDLTTGEREWSYYETRDAEAIELARRGNPIARSALTRIIARGRKLETREAAEEALRVLDAASDGVGKAG